MSPLDLVIVLQPYNPDSAEQRFTDWGIFTPPSGEHNRFDFAKWTLWHLVQNEGKTLRAAQQDACDKSSYTYDEFRVNLIFDVNRLHALGAIDIKGDKIILRRELTSPLELLARCAEG